ncbi:general stress protein [Roseomonas sp. ACRSG]|nr:general stress protein [Roseomonas sp. ACRSG]
MQKIITRMFDTRDHALAAVRDLEAAGFSHDDLGIVASNSDRSGVTDVRKDHDTGHASSGTGIGATLGTLVGGGAGLAAALGAIAIPGIGPIVAAGALVATLTGAGAGALAGGILGGLTGAGVSEKEAPVYAEGIRRGGSLVTVRTDDTRAAEVEAILARHNPVDMTAREADYRAGGWTGYDDSTPVDPVNDPARGTRASTPIDPLVPGGRITDPDRRI